MMGAKNWPRSSREGELDATPEEGKGMQNKAGAVSEKSFIYFSPDLNFHFMQKQTLTAV